MTRNVFRDRACVARFRDGASALDAVVSRWLALGSSLTIGLLPALCESGTRRTTTRRCSAATSCSFWRWMTVRLGRALRAGGPRGRWRRGDNVRASVQEPGRWRRAVRRRLQARPMAAGDEGDAATKAAPAPGCAQRAARRAHDRRAFGCSREDDGAVPATRANACTRAHARRAPSSSAASLGLRRDNGFDAAVSASRYARASRT